MTEQIEVAQGLFLTGHGALWLPGAGLAAVADLHIGYEASLGRRGAYLPSSSSGQTLARLLALLAELRPARLVVLGDLKHSTRGADAAEQRAVRELVDALAGQVELVLVRGNHDKGIERIARLTVADTVDAAGWTFAHGDALLAAERVVVGHEHPAFAAADAVGAGFRLPCFLVGRRSIVLPAFSPHAAGTDVTRLPVGGFLSPYTRCEAQRCYALEAGRLFLVARLDAV